MDPITQAILNYAQSRYSAGSPQAVAENEMGDLMDTTRLGLTTKIDKDPNFTSPFENFGKLAGQADYSVYAGYKPEDDTKGYLYNALAGLLSGAVTGYGEDASRSNRSEAKDKVLKALSGLDPSQLGEGADMASYKDDVNLFGARAKSIADKALTGSNRQDKGLNSVLEVIRNAPPPQAKPLSEKDKFYIQNQKERTDILKRQAGVTEGTARFNADMDNWKTFGGERPVIENYLGGKIQTPTQTTPSVNIDDATLADMQAQNPSLSKDINEARQQIEAMVGDGDLNKFTEATPTATPQNDLPPALQLAFSGQPNSEEVAKVKQDLGVDFSSPYLDKVNQVKELALNSQGQIPLDKITNQLEIFKKERDSKIAELKPVLAQAMKSITNEQAQMNLGIYKEAEEELAQFIKQNPDRARQPLGGANKTLGGMFSFLGKEAGGLPRVGQIVDKVDNATFNAYNAWQRISGIGSQQYGEMLEAKENFLSSSLSPLELYKRLKDVRTIFQAAGSVAPYTERILSFGGIDGLSSAVNAKKQQLSSEGKIPYSQLSQIMRSGGDATGSW